MHSGISGTHECNTATSVMVRMWEGSRGGQFLKAAKTLFNRKGNTPTVSSLKKKKAQNLVLHKALCRAGAFHLPSMIPLKHFWTFIYENTWTEVPVSHRTNSICPLVPLSNRFLRNSDDVRSQKNSIELIQWAKSVVLQMDSSGSAACWIEK